MALSEVGLESEKERLRTLRDYKLLDTPPKDDFDGFVTVAADFMRASMAFSPSWITVAYGSSRASAPTPKK